MGGSMIFGHSEKRKIWQDELTASKYNFTIIFGEAVDWGEVKTLFHHRLTAAVLSVPLKGPVSSNSVPSLAKLIINKTKANRRH